MRDSNSTAVESCVRIADIPLINFVQGLRVFNYDKSQLGTLRYSPQQHWLIAWDNGRQSFFGTLDPEDSSLLSLHVLMRNGKLVICAGWSVPNQVEFTSAE